MCPHDLSHGQCGGSMHAAIGDGFRGAREFKVVKARDISPRRVPEEVKCEDATTSSRQFKAAPRHLAVNV